MCPSLTGGQFNILAPREVNRAGIDFVKSRRAQLAGIVTGGLIMVKLAANLSFMFTEVAFLDRFGAAAEAGFKAVEFLFPYEWPAEELQRRLAAHGLTQALFNLPPGDWAKGERGLAAVPGREAEFEAAVRTGLAYAKALGCRTVHAMPGLRHHGTDRRTYVANLRKAATMAAVDGVTVVIEPINQRDIPGFFLSTTAEARAIIHEVGAPNLGLQFDIYHRAIQEGDVSMAIREFGHLAHHYQIANPPDRGEPDAGELDFRHIFKEIAATGYAGFVGCEYKPRATTRAGLAWIGRCGLSLG
jgi:hydroxypyruvate isomerase